LQQAGEHNEQGRCNADGSISRCKTDHCDGQSHQADDQQQRCLPSPTIGINAEQNAADRPHEKADAEG
jgi:hypothetical protein